MINYINISATTEKQGRDTTYRESIDCKISKYDSYNEGELIKFNFEDKLYFININDLKESINILENNKEED